MKTNTITPNLTPKQERFCQEYMTDLNATQAAIRAGYSAKTAQEQSSRLLSNVIVAGHIQQLRAKFEENTSITQSMVVEEIAKIAFSDIKALFDNDNRLLDVNKIPNTAAIASIKVQENETKEIKFHDKLKALELLGRYLGIFEKDNTQSKESAINIIYLGDGVCPEKEL